MPSIQIQAMVAGLTLLWVISCQRKKHARAAPANRAQDQAVAAPRIAGEPAEASVGFHKRRASKENPGSPDSEPKIKALKLNQESVAADEAQSEKSSETSPPPAEKQPVATPMPKITQSPNGSIQIDFPVHAEAATVSPFKTAAASEKHQAEETIPETEQSPAAADVLDEKLTEAPSEATEKDQEDHVSEEQQPSPKGSVSISVDTAPSESAASEVVKRQGSLSRAFSGAKKVFRKPSFTTKKKDQE